MQLPIAPKFAPQALALPLDEDSMPTSQPKPQQSSLYALAVVVRIGVLGAILFHTFALWSW